MIVFIPSAGTGERVNYHNPNINKTLIPYKNKPIISHIIESYPINFKFLIGLGYEGKILKNYLKIAHPERNIIFYNVSIFKGKRASLTRTINEGIKYIQEPFIFHANDMIVNYSIKNYEENFAVIDKKNKNFDLYRFFKIKGKKINMYEKSKNVKDKNFCFPYLGVSFIKDYKIFKEILTISKEKVVKSNF